MIATGGDQKQYEVVLDPARLAWHAVTLEDVERALTAANRNATAGFQVAEGQEYLIRGVGRLADTDAIAAVAVARPARCPCSSATSGVVREGAAIKRGEGSHNAKPAVILGIQKQPAVNTLELTAQIDATLDDIQRALPAGMQIHRDLFRQADFIEQSLEICSRRCAKAPDSSSSSSSCSYERPGGRYHAAGVAAVAGGRGGRAGSASASRSTA